MLFYCNSCRYIFEEAEGCQQCPDCGKKLYPFGKSHLEEIAGEEKLQIIGRVPMKPEFAEAADAGEFDKVRNPYLDVDFE